MKKPLYVELNYPFFFFGGVVGWGGWVKVDAHVAGHFGRIFSENKSASSWGWCHIMTPGEGMIYNLSIRRFLILRPSNHHIWNWFLPGLGPWHGEDVSIQTSYNFRTNMFIWRKKTRTNTTILSIKDPKQEKSNMPKQLVLLPVLLGLTKNLVTNIDHLPLGNVTFASP